MPSNQAIWNPEGIGILPLNVVILRRYKRFTRCRVTSPGKYFGTVQDFHPADVREVER